TDIRAIGVASAMHVSWTRTESGASFVLFETLRGGIGPTPDGVLPILDVTVTAPASGRIPAITELLTHDVPASDLAGQAGPECPILTLVYVPPPRICSSAGCDFNRDGFTDVRDLVLMVNCLHLRTACSTFADCNGDSIQSLDDVLCCAWKILRGNPCAVSD